MTTLIGWGCSTVLRAKSRYFRRAPSYSTAQIHGGAPIIEIAGFLGMSGEMLEKVYGHHHLDFQENIKEAF